MISTTSSSLATNVDRHGEQSFFPRPSRSHLCISCQISFQSGQEQRMHMKTPWHVYNLKRRIASFPPVPFDLFNKNQTESTNDARGTSKNSRSDDSSSSSDDEVVLANEGEQSASPFLCLFCSKVFPSDDAGLATNLEHMRIAHGMFIPNPETLTDMQSFIGYLATEVRGWHECLYCGATKSSTLSIQSHMRDKGHCLLNLDREPELLDFWESPPRWIDEDGDITAAQREPTDPCETEIRLASGRVISSRYADTATKNIFSKQGPAAATSMRETLSEDRRPSPLAVQPQPEPARQLALRDELSMLGISPQQRQMLVLAEKKAQRSEAVACRAREWVYAKGANSQKFDQMDNQMKWGKQNHKLLPR